MGCGDSTGAVRALKALAAQHSICEVTDVENLKKQYLPLLPGGSANSTAVVLGEELQGYYDDDIKSTCSYTCGNTCTWNEWTGCMVSCGSSVHDCTKVTDPTAVPSCIENIAGCMRVLGGSCCTCGSYFKALCCDVCN